MESVLFGDLSQEQHETLLYLKLKQSLQQKGVKEGAWT